VDGLDDLVEVPAGQVGAADAAFKERIAGHQQLERGKVQADRALRVARPTIWPSDRPSSGGAVSGVGMPIQEACIFIVLSSDQSSPFK